MEDQFRILMEHSLQGLAILQDKRVAFCNNTFAAITGYTIEELAAFTPEDLKKLLHPENREEIFSRYFAAGSEPSGASHFECRIVRKDDAVLWIEAKIAATDYQGKSALHISCLDVTNRKKTEIRLREAKENLDLIINSLGDAVFLKDRSHRLTHINDLFCRIYQMPREQILGKTTHDLLPKEVADKIFAQEERLFQTGEECLSEEEYRDSAGVLHVSLVKKSIIEDRYGNKQMICSLRDITEHRALQDQFLQSQKMEAIGVLANGMAHDFNNLLNVINGYTELIQEELGPDHEVNEDLERIREASIHAAKLTAQLMIFGQKQRRQDDLLRLDEVINNMHQILIRLIGDRVQLDIVSAPDLGLIQADPGQIQQMIMNLAVNARDAMPDGGMFQIEASNVRLTQEQARKNPAAKPGDYVRLTLRDNGIGMDAATQKRLFEPFFTTKKKGKGSGLGLSTVYGIVKQNNGFIEVMSEPGVGTKFSIYFPITPSGPR